MRQRSLSIPGVGLHQTDEGVGGGRGAGAAEGGGEAEGRAGR